MYEEELDPTIAELLEETANSLPSTSKTEKKLSVDIDLDNIPVDNTPIPQQAKKSNSNNKASEVDLSILSFKPITEFFSSTPSKVFDDTTYYKTALGGENESAQRLHTLLSKYLTCKDPKDKTVYRQQMLNVYWEFIKSLAPKMSNLTTPLCKRMLMRYGVVLPSLFTPEQKNTFSAAFIENNTGEPVYYLDEWFREIASGRLSLSVTDEARPARKNSDNPGEENAHLMQLKSKIFYLQKKTNVLW